MAIESNERELIGDHFGMNKIVHFRFSSIEQLRIKEYVYTLNYSWSKTQSAGSLSIRFRFTPSVFDHSPINNDRAAKSYLLVEMDSKKWIGSIKIMEIASNKRK